MALAPGAQLGVYAIEAQVGAGGMGEVYRARDTRLDRVVAIKILPPDLAGDATALARFDREAKAIAALSHPNILSVFDVGSTAETSFVVMEFLEGRTLRAHLERGPLSLRRSVAVAEAIARGLAAAHARGVVHRDLKPENVFLLRDGQVKLLDFGLARLSASPPAGHGTDRTTTITGAYTIVGTVGYMSPEQVRAEVVDARTDIFAFGVVLYEMLSGVRPFTGPSATDSLTAILRDDPPPIVMPSGQLPATLQRIVWRCLEKDPGLRFQSAEDLAFALQNAIPGSAEQSTQLSAPARNRRRSRSGRLLAATGIVLVAMGFLAGWRAAGFRRLGSSPLFQQLTWRHGNVLAARFAPDGRVVYGASWQGAAREIFTTIAANQESRPLGVTDAEIGALSSRGEIAILFGLRYSGRVLPLPATLALANLEGAGARPHRDGVRGVAYASDGRTRALVIERAGRHVLEYPEGKVLLNTEDTLVYPRVSPDGLLVAYLRYPGKQTRRAQIEAIDSNGHHVPLSPLGFSVRGIAWTPDGREVWATVPDGGKGVTNVEAFSFRGSHRVVLRLPSSFAVLQDLDAQGRALITLERIRARVVATASGPAGERDLSWLDGTNIYDISSDGRRVLLAEMGAAGGVANPTYLRGLDATPAVKIAEGGLPMDRSLSPDGRWLLLSEQTRHRLVPTGTGDARTLEAAGLRDLRGTQFLSDGSALVFSAADSRGKRKLYLQKTDGSGPRALPIEVPETDSTGLDGREFLLSPDGRQVLVRDHQNQPRLASLDGGHQVAVPGLGDGERVFGWRAEGLFVSRHPDSLPLLVEIVDPLTGRREAWRSLSPADPAGQITGLGLVVKNRRTYGFDWVETLSDLFLVTGIR